MCLTTQGTEAFIPEEARASSRAISNSPRFLLRYRPSLRSIVGRILSFRKRRWASPIPAADLDPHFKFEAGKGVGKRRTIRGEHRVRKSAGWGILGPNDENVEPINFTALARFDVVGVTGMNVQKRRMREILVRLRELGVFVVVGGAYPSVDERYFDGLCDALFVGEAETTWPEFLEAYAQSKPFLRVNLKYRRDAIGFAQFANRCVTHWHFYRFTREASAGRLRLFNNG